MIIILSATFTHADKNNLTLRQKINSYRVNLHQIIQKEFWKK